MTEQRAVCPTCGGPVMFTRHPRPYGTLFERIYTYAPPSLDAADRAVVEAVMAKDDRALNRAAAQLLAARAAAQEATP